MSSLTTIAKCCGSELALCNVGYEIYSTGLLARNIIRRRSS
jgi:hypothetical protein